MRAEPAAVSCASSPALDHEGRAGHWTAIPQSVGGAARRAADVWPRRFSRGAMPRNSHRLARRLLLPFAARGLRHERTRTRAQPDRHSASRALARAALARSLHRLWRCTEPHQSDFKNVLSRSARTAERRRPDARCERRQTGVLFMSRSAARPKDSRSRARCSSHGSLHARDPHRVKQPPLR